MNDMYNQELKQRYIEEKEATTVLPKGYLARCFRKTAEFENRNGKDISNFTFYEILDMYKTWNVISYEILQVCNSQLSLYTQWCLQQSLVVDAQNHYLEFNKEIFISCTNIAVQKKKYMTRKQVLELARSLKNPSDGFIFLALFEGIGGQANCEFANLRISDFHDGKVTLCAGRTIPVSNDLYNLALEANQETNYYSVTSDHVFKLNPEDLIIKNYPNSSSDLEGNITQRITSRIRRNTKANGISYVTSTSLKESGKIDFIKRRSEELGISTEEFVRTRAYEVEQQFSCNIQSKMVYYDKYKEYLA